MATLHDTVPPRRKIATYGKAARRRIPEYSFTAARKSQTPEVPKKYDSQASTSVLSQVSHTKLGSIPRRSVSRALSSASPPSDVFDAPLRNDEARQPLRKTNATPSKSRSVQIRAISRTPPSAPPGSAGIFDVPTGGDDAPKPRFTREPARAVPGKSIEVKATKKKVAPTDSLSTSRSAPDVFDMPSSDEEARGLKHKQPHKVFRKIAAVHNSQGKDTHKTADDIVEEVGSRKRLKLSPEDEPPSPRRLPSNTIARRPKLVVGEKPTKSRKCRNTSPKTGQFAKITARPKFEAPLKLPVQKAIQPETPKKPNPLEVSTPSPQLSDIDMMDVDPGRERISPKSLKMWQALLDPAGDTEMAIVVSTARDVRGQPSRKENLNILSRPAGVAKASQISPRRPPRRRLIDCLVEQAAEDSEEESSAEENTQPSSDSAPPSSPALAQPVSRGQSGVPEAANLPPITSDSQGSQGTGPKFTYSKQRSMLAEADLMKQLAMEIPIPPSEPSQGRRARMALVAPLRPLTSFHEDEDEDGATAAVKSVHELRKSGANNRFLDEIQDFLDRIGSPGKTSVSMRRSGLLDLGSKMKDKSFAEKFRANGMEQKLFLHLGQETDIVSSFMIVSLLAAVLIEGNMPHIVAQLRRQGITRLLIRLLECQSSIAAVAKDRKSNMSKVAQSLLIEHGDYIMLMPTWEELKPQVISPRTLALKCLEVMVRQTREAGNSGDIFSKELTTNLFAILKSASDERSWDLPKDKSAIDFYLALSALESHSITARTVHDETIWINDFLPIVAETLEIALSRPVDDFGMLQILLLRLTLNVTNNNSKASDVFGRPALMSLIGKVIVAKFKQISRFLTEDELFVAVEHLILALGVMINFAEWSAIARESMQSLEGGSEDPLDAMVQAFADNQERTSQADSVQESQKNVAFGYLSVLLGYLSLLPSISQRIQSRQPRKTLRPIVASIEEFIGHHKTVDMIAADEDGYNPQSGLTERLENLVNKLAELKVEVK